ncbi:restriction endonuclease (plasmid) [Clostridium botulinum]|uniref:Restriction endonuclease n=1 Tax=Clostridium botulinum C/D str. DC5 TaxID=1443128 RepID=A0A0A0HXK3_CLOBO|nr:restriction endonuclease [Clostridium botulinum]KGM93232.1 restriction endonuclease [Clostridium botulinum C/D str. DC5]KOC50923.1 restriction endonuclease [Clostridium botulinum]KOC52306.1 restriction endonuclease [Clostridium botulinum]MCD3235244.1 restriction endonuclease [Clostridium botulinum D/C]MCD3241165.1 restriction endonuclease [Clostridium botulinum D/C]
MEKLDYGNFLLIMFVIMGIVGYINIAITRSKAIKHHSKYLTRMQILKILDKIEKMTGREFEEFCVYLFNQTNEYKRVKLTAATNDGGKDIVMTDLEGNTVFVECKRYDESMIGREIIQKLVGAMVQNGVQKGILITTSKLNDNALQCLNEIKKHSDLQIDVIELYAIQDMLEKYCDDSILKELDIDFPINQTNVCNSKL